MPAPIGEIEVADNQIFSYIAGIFHTFHHSHEETLPPPINFRAIIRRSARKLLAAGLLLTALTTQAQLPMQCAVLPPASSGQAGTQLPPPSNPPGPVNPTNCGQVQNIRVNVHFLQKDDGTGNFTATNDGNPTNPSTATTGYDYAQGLIWACNGQMDQNPVLRLAPGSSLTTVAKRVRWVLDGVYFDRSSTYRIGAYNPDHVPKLYGLDYDPLCVRADSVINIFLVEEDESPYTPNGPVATPAARGYVTQQAQCDSRPAPAKLWAVVSSPWTKYILANTAAWAMATTLNHELGHLLGLNHPFQSASFTWGVCSDAPASANCWNLNEPPIADCNAWSKVSNNLMDTNADQSALAPCQISIIQNNLNTCLKDRFVYKCSNCLPTIANFQLPETTCGSVTNIWLDGRATWANHYFTIDIDQIDGNGNPVIGTHFSSPQFWRNVGREQLDALYTFLPSRRYRVKLATFNNCGSASVKVSIFDTFYCPIYNPNPPQRTTTATTSSSTSTPRPKL